MIIYIIIFILFYIVLFSFSNQDKILNNNNYNITNNGFTVLKNIFNIDEIIQLTNYIKNNQHKDCKEYLIKHPKLKSVINKKFGINYMFQDYITIIQKSSIHTCHRDVNSIFLNKDQKHPSYTMIIYLENMNKCLGVIPNSHTSLYKNSINIFDQVKNIPCNQGDIILFNANLIHVGTLNPEKEDNLRIQMKVSHKDDLNALSYYQNYNKILKKSTNIPVYLRQAQKNISCMVPIISDFLTKEIKKTARGTEEGANIGPLQKIFSYLFYGNANFYDLPNAF